MKHSEVLHQLRAARCRVQEIECDGGGRAAVCALGGRIISLRLPGLDENVFWSSPEIHKHEVWQKRMWDVAGGIGGVRLWFAPEFAYHWTGKPDLVHYSNYNIPRLTDPGAYRWLPAGKHAVTLTAKPKLRDHRDGSTVSFAVERTIAATANPIGARAARYAGVRIQHTLKLLHAKPGQRVDLWHIVQMPPGSRMLIPTHGRPEPLVYFDEFKRGAWRIGKDCVTWHYTGDQTAKFGLDTGQVTGRAGVLRRLGNGEWAALLWQFPVMPGANYCDGPDARRARKQISQAWDGFGFGELEYHSASVGREDPSYAESSLLWCFAGTLQRVNEIAEQLLGRRWNVRG